jgi:hypothetical protein
VISPKEFVAHKTTIAGGTVEASGTQADLIAGALKPMMPLASSDVFQLQIGSEVNLTVLQPLVTVTPEPGVSMNNLLDWVEIEGAIDVEAFLIASSLRFASEEGTVTDESHSNICDIYRNALVMTPNATWQIVGIRSEDKVETVLREAWTD